MMGKTLRAVKDCDAIDSILSNRTVIEWKSSAGPGGRRKRVVLYGAAHKTWCENRLRTWMVP